MNRTSRRVLHQMVLLALRFLSLLVTLTILLELAGLILPLFDDVKRFQLTGNLLMLNERINQTIGTVLPTVIMGHSITTWVVLPVAFLLRHRLNIAAMGQVARIVQLTRLPTEKILPKSQPNKLNPGALARFLRFLRDTLLYRRSKLRRLQRKITRLSAELDKFGRELVFLSIDVVDSTKMKEKRDHSVIAVHFDKYQEFVRKILKEHDLLKASWTPDGVMACFTSYANAFHAAKKIIIHLPAFNQEHRGFDNEFRIRCGINGGLVLFDETLGIEEIASHAIDIAAHVQKAAPANALFVTRQSIEPKNMITSLVPVSGRIDGCEVFMWDLSGAQSS